MMEEAKINPETEKQIDFQYWFPYSVGEPKKYNFYIQFTI